MLQVSILSNLNLNFFFSAKNSRLCYSILIFLKINYSYRLKISNLSVAIFFQILHGLKSSVRFLLRRQSCVWAHYALEVVIHWCTGLHTIIYFYLLHLIRYINSTLTTFIATFVKMFIKHYGFTELLYFSHTTFPLLFS